jgi:DNA modification methylase
MSGVRDEADPYYRDDAVTLWHGDSLAVLSSLPSGSVDCCVTSPPYFGLRDYGEAGQYGLESSPAEYVETMRAVFAEVRRVLADDGTLWLNIGDSYSTTPAGGAGRGRSSAMTLGNRRVATIQTGGNRVQGVPYKSLIGIPWRVAFALMDDGWLIRQEVIWAKRSCMPEAVTDRPSRAHEQVFLLSKKPRYWYDADAIREDSKPEQTEHNERYAKVYSAQADRAAATGQPGNVNSAGIHARPGKAGRNSRSVWSLSTMPFPDAHFATMPLSLAERCVQAGCKPGGTVLDPFSGSGTTGLAANKHGRKYVGIDLSADYLDLSLRTRFAQPGLDLSGEASA